MTSTHKDKDLHLLTYSGFYEHILKLSNVSSIICCSTLEFWHFINNICNIQPNYYLVNKHYTSFYSFMSNSMLFLSGSSFFFH